MGLPRALRLSPSLELSGGAADAVDGPGPGDVTGGTGVLDTEGPAGEVGTEPLQRVAGLQGDASTRSI